ncbi:MAG: hypothetical protein JO288_12730 [Hyphomicrobiales bacterium]|nr:hypothetical protein [Hyphomicrobiales bacterium]
MIPRPTLTLSLILAAVVAAAVFGHGHVRPSGKKAAAKEVASAEAPRPAAPTASSPPPARPAPAASAPEVPIAPVAPRAAAPEAATAAIAPEPPRRMTAAEESGFDAWMMKAYLGCWKPAAPPADLDPYVARVRLAFKPDGSLSKPPKLVNPPSDPAQKPQAKSVMRAVKACDPLSVPAQYRPFYEQWKTKTLHFDPQIAAR